MKAYKEGEEIIYLIDGLAPGGEECKFGITKKQTEKLARRGLSVKVAQLVAIVSPGLILAEHVFQGLNRPLSYNGNQKADGDKLAYTWRAVKDYDWGRPRRFDPDGIEEMPPPDDCVYMVIVSPNRKNEYPSVKFWIERWFWVKKSETLAGAPINYDKRFKCELSLTRKED